MHRHDRARAGRRRAPSPLATATLFAIATGVAGCATTLPPAPAWLPAKGDVARSPYGAFAALRVESDDPRHRLVSGELIAIESDSTHLLTEDPGAAWVAVANERIESFGVRDHTPPGGFHVYSRGRGLTRGVGRGALSQFRSRARFPQGLPADLDRFKLRSPWAPSSQ